MHLCQILCNFCICKQAAPTSALSYAAIGIISHQLPSNFSSQNDIIKVYTLAAYDVFHNIFLKAKFLAPQKTPGGRKDIARPCRKYVQ